MNCPTCKNPLTNSATNCEWCGGEIINLETENQSSNVGKINVTISFEGVWLIIDSNVKIYADDILVGIGSLKNGFQINFTIEKPQPTILIKIMLMEMVIRSQKIELPKFDFGASYEIKVRYSRTWGNFSSKPLDIQKK